MLLKSRPELSFPIFGRDAVPDGMGNNWSAGRPIEDLAAWNRSGPTSPRSNGLTGMPSGRRASRRSKGSDQTALSEPFLGVSG